MQRAGVAALEHGEDFVALQVARARRGRDIVCDALGRTGRCRFAVPQGAFYLFFRSTARPTRAARVRLIDEAHVGLAPGTAFGAGGEHFVRVCYARDPDQVADAMTRRGEGADEGGERLSAKPPRASSPARSGRRRSRPCRHIEQQRRRLEALAEFLFELLAQRDEVFVPIMSI